MEFHAREARSQRFAGDWPLPWPVWKGRAWGGFFSFWFGLFYQIFSDFGRSLIRPFAFWLLAAALGAAVYLGQSPDIAEMRAGQRAESVPWFARNFGTAWDVWWKHKRKCYAGEPDQPKPDAPNPPPYIGALSQGLRKDTDLANEAWHLAFRNAFIILDGSSEAAHRSFGCLYGVELYGGSNPLAVVPSAVSTASAIQKLFSGLTIFLFGLALRNMLKMK